MKVFISSVRRGLESERDALPGLIKAIGHEPIAFEQFTAQARYQAAKRAWMASRLQSDARREPP